MGLINFPIKLRREEAERDREHHHNQNQKLIKMGSLDEEIEAERTHDMEETIFVAVGKHVDKSKRTLLWALDSFPGKKICLLHVLLCPPPANLVAFMDAKLSLNRLDQDEVKAFQQLEKEKMHDFLYQYSLILSQKGVQADKVWIEMDSTDKGIVEIIARFNVRWLVMGAAADKYYSKKLSELKSKKAMFVCQHAPTSCHIWFVCKGHLIYTREGRYIRSEEETGLPLLRQNSYLETDQQEHLRLDSVTQVHRSLDAEELEGILGWFDDQCSVHSSQSTSMELSISKLIPLLTDEEQKTPGQLTQKTSCTLQRAIIHAEDLKQKTILETMKRWKEEDNTMGANCKAKALENLCIKEISLRKELEEALAKEKQEVEKTKNQRDELRKELQMVQEQKSVLESQIAESQCVVKELDEKIISAVELLISFKKKRDVARVEYENAIREVRRLRSSAKVEALSFSKPEILEFSFLEINEATHNFDPTWKIGEGRYGSVYKGLIRHVHVAIKMLPSYGSQSLLDFQNGVEVLSRIRHPNLVTLIGTCPESRSLVYECARNGSLEDRLACKGKTTPLMWQTRIHIAIQICSALLFLHSNKPCIIHGNLKPSKILLDADFVSKISDFGMFCLIPHGENMEPNCKIRGKTNPSFSSLNIDPEYLEAGILTPESDVFSFGIILLRLLTGRPPLGIVENVRCALEKENFKAVLDYSAGDWPLEEAKQLANLALRCCERNRFSRPDLLSVLELMKDSGIDSESRLGSKEARWIPSHFVCPIFQEVMKDPQIAADGFTYDAEAIRGWLKSGHNTSPMTNLKLEHCNLLPNHALHQAIQEWRQHC